MPSFKTETNAELYYEFERHLLLERGLSLNTRKAYLSDIALYIVFCENQNQTLTKVTTGFLNSYLLSLSKQGLSATSIARKTKALKNFYRRLLIDNITSKELTAFLKSPKTAKTLPSKLTPAEIEKLLTYPAQSFKHMRTVTIIELFYASGIRVSELINLQLENVNLTEGWILAFGKGSKERLVPINAQAAARLKNYLAKREQLFGGKNASGHVFVNSAGKKISRVSVWKDIHALGIEANLPRSLHPHLFRHTFASHLIQGGADLKSVQEMLGHSDLSTTQIYTHIDDALLKQKHSQFHPRG